MVKNNIHPDIKATIICNELVRIQRQCNSSDDLFKLEKSTKQFSKLMSKMVELGFCIGWDVDLTIDPLVEPEYLEICIDGSTFLKVTTVVLNRGFSESIEITISKTP